MGCLEAFLPFLVLLYPFLLFPLLPLPFPAARPGLGGSRTWTRPQSLHQLPLTAIPRGAWISTRRFWTLLHNGETINEARPARILAWGDGSRLFMYI
jgi:hypothetical protein